LVALEGTYVRRHLHQGWDATPHRARLLKEGLRYVFIVTARLVNRR
jgi:hypothetical protein